MKKRINKKLILIILVGAFLRLIFLTSSPPSLNWDETSIAYNAYSILKTGRDEWGRVLPLSFRAFGEHKLPGMVYASVPLIAILGLNPAAVRLTPALAGILTIYAIYLLAREIFSRKHALKAAAVLAILPWHIHLSRASFEATLGLLFFTLSLYYFQKFKSSGSHSLPLIISLALSLYTYNSLRILVPLLGFTYFIIYRKKLLSNNLKSKTLLISFFLLLISLPFLINYISSDGLLRLNVISFWNQPAYIHSIEVLRNNFSGPGLFAKLIYNRYTFFVYNFLKNIFSHFSPSFIFIKGDAYTQRSTQGYGLLHIYEIIPIILGLKLLVQKHNNKIKLLLPLAVLPTIPSSLTIISPSSLQSIYLIPFFVLLESIGLVYLYRRLISLGKKLQLSSLAISALVVVFSLSLYTHKLFWAYPREYAADWQYGYEELFSRLAKSDHKFDTIYITTQKGEPYIFTLFYNRYDPSFFQNSETVDKNLDPLGWVHVNSLDNYRFVDFSLSENNPDLLLSEGNVLIVGNEGEIAKHAPSGIIKDPGGNTSFELFTSQDTNL